MARKGFDQIGLAFAPGDDDYSLIKEIADRHYATTVGGTARHMLSQRLELARAGWMPEDAQTLDLLKQAVTPGSAVNRLLRAAVKVPEVALLVDELLQNDQQTLKTVTVMVREALSKQGAKRKRTNG